MSSEPRVRFLSLFVADLEQECERLARVLGVEPEDRASSAPSVHPCSPRAPRVFRLGDVELALYACDGKTTHPGDLGIGLSTREPGALTQRAIAAGATLLRRGTSAEPLRIFMLPSRHFFEALAAPAGAEAEPERFDV